MGTLGEIFTSLYEMTVKIDTKQASGHQYNTVDKEEVEINCQPGSDLSAQAIPTVQATPIGFGDGEGEEGDIELSKQQQTTIFAHATGNPVISQQQSNSNNIQQQPSQQPPARRNDHVCAWVCGSIVIAICLICTGCL